MSEPQLDREKLRAVVRRLDVEDLLRVLDRAMALLPPASLLTLIEGYVWPSDLLPDGEPREDPLGAVRRFTRASLEGRYYESFTVNSRNCTQKSRGTQVWIAECHRLLDLCLVAARERPDADVRAAFETLFLLLQQVDELPDEIIFLADEHGSWQVSVHWREVLPAWFACLALSAEPDEFASAVRSAIGYFVHYDAARLLSEAQRVATEAQRAGLEALPAPERYGSLALGWNLS